MATKSPPPSSWAQRPASRRAAVTGNYSGLSLLVLLVLDVGAASASICKAGLCTREQYCCGDGKCCDNVYSLWYLW